MDKAEDTKTQEQEPEAAAQGPLAECENGRQEAVEVEAEAEAEKDVFSGISDSEDTLEVDGGLSREQRSFARYESPRGAEGGQEANHADRAGDRTPPESSEASSKPVAT